MFKVSSKLALWLLLGGTALAQTVNPEQIRPSVTGGYVLTTIGGTTVWAPGGGSGANLIIPGTNVSCTPFVSGACVGNVTINSTGGGSTPPSPAFSVPFTNSGVTAFQSDTPFTYTPSTQLFQNKNQDISGSLVHFVVNPIQ